MKKLTLAVLAVAIMGTTTLAQADTRTASAVALLKVENRWNGIINMTDHIQKVNLLYFAPNI